MSCVAQRVKYGLVQSERGPQSVWGRITDVWGLYMTLLVRAFTGPQKKWPRRASWKRQGFISKKEAALHDVQPRGLGRHRAVGDH